MNTLHKYKKIFLGRDGDNQPIYLSPPKWDCEWYWGFGYLGNSRRHYHVSGLTKHEWYDTEKQVFRVENLNLFDGFKKHFGDSLVIKNDRDLWEICELFKTFYTLREYSDTIHRGGSHYTKNPCSNLVKNEKEYLRINNEVLPAIFDEIYKILEKYST